jgi:hypothetical protein
LGVAVGALVCGDTSRPGERFEGAGTKAHGDSRANHLGPTLAYLLEHHARELGIEPLPKVLSAGCSTVVKWDEPMLEVAQRALRLAGERFKTNIAAPLSGMDDAARLSALTTRGANHRSESVEQLAVRLRHERIDYLAVFAMGAESALTLRSPGVAPILSSLTRRVDVNVPDDAWERYAEFKDQWHPEVVAAYKRQAHTIADRAVELLESDFKR